MDQQFKALGINHFDAPLALREKLAYQEVSAKGFMKKLKEVFGLEEAMVISTCNRTEVYFSSDHTSTDDVMRLLCADHAVKSEEMAPYMHFYESRAAVEHMFRVSLGLEAKVLGDIQIINQVKRAYQWSADENMAGPFLHRLMHTVFFVNKRVVQETAFRDGAGSVASVAVSLIATISGQVMNPKVVLVGMGEIGQNVLENLQDNYTDITLVNRNRAKAEVFAQANGYQVGDFENLQQEIAHADVIIVAVSADKPLISAGMLAPSLTPKLFVDLSVPRAIDEDVELVPGVILYNIDQIEEKAGEVLDIRLQAKAQVEDLLAESLEEFMGWSQEMLVSPTIKLFKEKLEQIRKEELARYVNKLPDKEYEMLESVTKGIIQKVVKLPVLELKAACKRGEADTLVEALHEIFNLERTTAKKP